MAVADGTTPCVYWQATSDMVLCVNSSMRGCFSSLDAVPAAAFLGGLMRMSASMCLILMEMTGKEPSAPLSDRVLRPSCRQHTVQQAVERHRTDCAVRVLVVAMVLTM
jgi:hypothetical protein